MCCITQNPERWPCFRHCCLRSPPSPLRPTLRSPLRSPGRPRFALRSPLPSRQRRHAPRPAPWRSPLTPPPPSCSAHRCTPCPRRCVLPAGAVLIPAVIPAVTVALPRRSVAGAVVLPPPAPFSPTAPQLRSPLAPLRPHYTPHCAPRCAPLPAPLRSPLRSPAGAVALPTALPGSMAPSLHSPLCSPFHSPVVLPSLPPLCAPRRRRCTPPPLPLRPHRAPHCTLRRRRFAPHRTPRPNHCAPRRRRCAPHHAPRPSHCAPPPSPRRSPPGHSFHTALPLPPSPLPPAALPIAPASASASVPAAARPSPPCAIITSIDDGGIIDDTPLPVYLVVPRACFRVDPIDSTSTAFVFRHSKIGCDDATPRAVAGPGVPPLSPEALVYQPAYGRFLFCLRVCWRRVGDLRRASSSLLRPSSARAPPFFCPRHVVFPFFSSHVTRVTSHSPQTLFVDLRDAICVGHLRKPRNSCVDVSGSCNPGRLGPRRDTLCRRRCCFSILFLAPLLTDLQGQG
ncbi:hypothetical protein C8R44DRAFT_124310 [Mycena epipterygia]|nr:hypothetical protein C8R44DRAFT_124310 [Mycena epipterygia]